MSERLGIAEAISIRVLGPNMPAGTTRPDHVKQLPELIFKRNTAT